MSTLGTVLEVVVLLNYQLVCGVGLLAALVAWVRWRRG